MHDYEIYTRDTANLFIPVYTPAGLPVDLANAVIVWSLTEWSGGPAILEKSKAGGVVSNEIEIGPAEGEVVPNQVVVKIQPDDLDFPGGLYIHHIRVSFVNAVDTVRQGTILLLESPAP